MTPHAKALGALSAIGLWLVALALPQTALASLRCERGSEGAVLSISVTDGTFATVRRAGDGIKVFDSEHPKKGCQLGATVSNTDRIQLFSGEDTAVYIDLSKGPFAPGLTPDGDAASEIEWEISGPGLVELVGGRGHDHFRFMGSGLEAGVNLNADVDKDVDVVLSGETRDEAIFVVSGGAGPDRIDVLGAPALETFAVGGPGDDTLLATPAGSILEGGSGSDRLIGGPATDLIVPGPGADLVRAGAGSDDLELNRDGRRDRINCGPGNDLAFGADRFDRLKSCK
jgi:Ca2+-binding RTX toxin-like protein